MTREMKFKRVLFYCTAILFFVSPFAFETVVDHGVTDGTIVYYSILITFIFATVAKFWGCTKKEFEEITGMDIFNEE